MYLNSSQIGLILTLTFNFKVNVQNFIIFYIAIKMVLRRSAKSEVGMQVERSKPSIIG